MKRIITALAAGGLLLVGGCSSSEPADATPTTTTSAAPRSLTTVDEFLAAADELTPIYTPCSEALRTPECKAAAEKGDTIVSDILYAAYRMPGNWNRVVQTSKDILDASTKTSQGCAPVSPGSRDYVTKTTECMSAMTTMKFATHDMKTAVYAANGGW